jgi:Mg2+-importing ATPase
MIERFMIYLGPVSSVFDYATFGLMWFHFGAHDPKMQGLFQSGWFVEGLLSQTLIVHMIRTPKIPFIESRASWPLLLTTAAVMGAGVWIPYSALGSKLGFAPLPIGFFPWLAAILLGYCLLAHLVKRWFVQRFGFS